MTKTNLGCVGTIRSDSSEDDAGDFLCGINGIICILLKGKPDGEYEGWLADDKGGVAHFSVTLTGHVIWPGILNWHGSKVELFGEAKR